MRRKKYYDGYMTVEASFIVPAAIMILALLLYWGFFCYDKSVSVQCCYLAALRASNEWDLTASEAKQMVAEELEKMTDQTFLFINRENMNVKVGLLNIEAGISGRMKILFSELRGDDMENWLTDSTKSASRLKASSYIRRYRLLGEVRE